MKVLAERELATDRLYMDWRAWELLKQSGQRHSAAGALMRESVKRSVHQIGAIAVALQIEDVVEHLRALPYAEYLNTFEWRQTRFFALWSARWRCRLCNSDKRSLHVHHRSYRRLGCEPLSDLTVLCAECHEAHHEREAA